MSNSTRSLFAQIDSSPSFGNFNILQDQHAASRSDLRKFDPEVVVQRGGHFRVFIGGVASRDDAEDGALEWVRRRADGASVADPNDVLGVRRQAAVARRAHLRQKLGDLGQARPGLAGGHDGRLQVSAPQAVEDHRPHGHPVDQSVFEG